MVYKRTITKAGMKKPGFENLTPLFTIWMTEDNLLNFSQPHCHLKSRTK